MEGKANGPRTREAEGVRSGGPVGVPALAGFCGFLPGGDCYRPACGPVGVPALAGFCGPGRLKSVHQPVPPRFRHFSRSFGYRTRPPTDRRQPITAHKAFHVLPEAGTRYTASQRSESTCERGC